MKIYDTLEDKWYSIIDKIDETIPIAPIIDKIDERVPSLVIFLALIILILLFFTIDIFADLNETRFSSQKEILVISKDNLPINNVSLQIDSGCIAGIISIKTDSAGKANFTACDEKIVINANKDGYQQKQKTAHISDERIILTLNPINIQLNPKIITIEVNDTRSQKINSAKIEIICDSNTLTFTNQPINGWQITLPHQCQTPQIRATAPNFVQQTIVLSASDQRRVIELEEINNTGTIYFQTTTDAGPIIAEINIMNEFGETFDVKTNSVGTANLKLTSGKYNYTAISNVGEIKNGNFELEPNQQKLIEIKFDQSQDPTTPTDPTTPIIEHKFIAIEIVDEEEKAINDATIKLILTDGNQLTPRKTNTTGRTTPQPILNTQLKIKAIVTANTFETKIFDVELQNNNEYQTVKLRQGGAKLKIITKNDINSLEASALVTITHPQIPNSPLLTGYTNREGELIFENLPPANYSLFASDRTQRDEANINVIINKDEDKEIIITLITGTGSLRYNFFDSQKNRTDSNIIVYEKEIEKLSIYNGPTTNNFYNTPITQRSKNIIVEINDNNFFPKESIPYQVNRGTTQKEIFVTRPNDLPNNNPVQLILEQIYSTNPITSNMSLSTRANIIQQDSSYWLYFTLILNNENQGTALANFYTTDNNFLINNIYSIDNSILLMSSQKEEQIIEQNENPNLVTKNAVQANLKKLNVKGPKAIPIIVEIKTDQNANIMNLNFDAIHISDETLEISNSLNYKREFVVGERICFQDCPQFLINNFIEWKKENGENTTNPAHQIENILLIGDEYKLITTITNLTDNQFENLVLTDSINENMVERLEIENNQNTKTHSLNIEPFSTSSQAKTNLKPKLIGIIPLTQTISGENISQSRDNINTIRFRISQKNELEIEISPQTINEKTNYPIFIIKTKYKNQIGGVPANYRIEINNQQIHFGETDVNGIAIINLNTTNYNKGDTIKFYANDDEGSIPAYLETTLTEKYPPIIIEEPCIEITGEKVVTLNKGQTTNFNITSTCSEEKVIFINSELTTSQRIINLQENSTQTLTVTANPRGELLGVYPVQIMLMDDSHYKQIKHADIIINDPESHFNLETFIFDLSTINQIESKITNKNFSGRQNNFYPRMQIDTRSVNLEYDQPGIPEEFTFEAVVKGFGIESNVYGLIASDLINAEQYKGTKCRDGSSTNPCRNPKNLPGIPDSVTGAGTDLALEFCEILIDEGETFEKPNPPLDESGLITILPEFIDYESGRILPPEGIMSDFEINEDNNPNAELGSFSNKNELKNNSNESSKISFSASNTFTVNNSLPMGEATSTPRGEINTGPLSNTTNFKIEYHWSFFSDIYGAPTMGLPLPPKHGEYWGEGHELLIPLFTVLEIKNANMWKAEVEEAAIAGEGLFVKYHVEGARKKWYDRGTFSNKNYTAEIKSQVDKIMVAEFLNKRVGEWRQEVTIPTTEGIAHRVGYYMADATPAPEGTNEDTIHGHSPGDSWQVNMSLMTAACAFPNGFVAPEKAIHLGFELPNQNHPYVEYDSIGLFGYIIPHETVPDDLRVYLYDGQYYAEYVGQPTINDDEINFRITKSNLMGSEYVILEVFDWVGDEIKKQSYQIKLVSEDTTCISGSGDIGFTGPEFTPNLLFDWDWSRINANQCDKLNPNSIYCDATQFMISLLKRIDNIENLLQSGNLNQIPLQTSFDAYLIKDSYNQNFLNDFENYYSSTIANASPAYTQRLKNYLTQNKLIIESEMPYGGIYNVTINIPNIAVNTNTLFDTDGVPFENITVKIEPLQKAPNYSPFYELPFNGPIGLNQRNGYGVVANKNINLDNSIILTTSGTGATNLNVITPTNLKEIQKGFILNYKKDSEFIFTPSQPTPIIWKIESPNGKINNNFRLDKQNTLDYLNWLMIGSNMGGNVCQDFERKTNTNFTIPKINEEFQLNLNGNQAGTISLGTVIFTLQTLSADNLITIIPDAETQMIGTQLTQNQDNVILNYYESMQNNTFNNLKGIFENIKNRKVCISNTPEETKLYWNPEYLSNLVKGINQSNQNNCGFEISTPFISTIERNFN